MVNQIQRRGAMEPVTRKPLSEYSWSTFQPENPQRERSFAVVPARFESLIGNNRICINQTALDQAAQVHPARTVPDAGIPSRPRPFNQRLPGMPGPDGEFRRCH
jgi:hypothetical protein